MDMCAAPGGKSSHLAQLMNDSGMIYAFDNSGSRLSKLSANMRRLGVRSVTPIRADSRYLHVDYPHLKADRVLIDPPCSAIGVRPKLFERKSLRDIFSCVKYQVQFFEPAVELLKVGGVLVYSTCTLTPDENESVVNFALENFPLELDRQPIYFGSSGLSLLDDAELVQRFYPDIHDTSGYFIARFVKR